LVAHASAFLLVLALAGAPGLARAEDRVEWAMTRWTTDDGLPQNSVAAIAKDHDGFLWLATQEGLVRFDGVEFRVFGSEQGLPCPSMLALLTLDDGAVAVGSEGCGAFEVRRGQVRRILAVPSDLRIRAVARRGDGELLWGTDRGLIATRGASSRWLFRGDEVVSIAVRPEQAVVFATLARVGELRGGSVRWLTNCLSDPDRLSTVAISGDRLWIGSRDRGLCSIDLPTGRTSGPTATRVYTAADGLPSQAIKAVTPFPDGSVWVATLSGAARFDGERFVRPETEGAELASASLAPDADGTVWIGGQLTGLAVVRPRRVHTYGPADGLADKVVWAVAEDHGGHVWVATEAAGIHELVDARFVNRTPPTMDRDTSAGTIVQGPDGSMWFGTPIGLWRLVGSAWERFTTADGLPSADVRAVTFDRDGSMLVGTTKGLARRAAGGGAFIDVTATLGLPLVSYELVIPDPARGGWWLAGSDLFGFLSHDHFEPRDLNGHPNVSAVLVTNDGVLVGTGSGLARVTAAGVRWLKPAQGLPSDQVLAMARRGDDYWITSNKGPYRIAARELDAFFNGRVDRVTPVRYGKRDGMISAECNTAGATSLLIASDRRVWVPTVAGIAVFDPERWHPAGAPKAVIDRVRDADRVDLPIASELGFKLGHRDFEATFTAPEFASPDQVTFRYQLAGYDHDWVDAGARRTVTYTNLAPGRYQLRVAARLPGGSWGEPAVVTVAMPAHLYEARWFVWASIAVAALLAIGAAAFAVNAARRREVALRERVRERTHELDAALQRTATSEANFRHLLSRLPVAVSLVRDGEVVYANEEVLRLSGCTSLDALSGEPFAGVSAPGEQREQRCERPDGSVAVVEFWCLDLRHEGEPARICLGRDVTRRNQLESMLRTTERMASIGTLAAGVAHEINNPLAYVIANLAFLAEGLPQLRREAGGLNDPPGNALTEALLDAQEGAGRVERIVRDLRTFSRPGADQDGDVELIPVIESTLNLCRNEIRQRAQLEVELATVPPVLCSEQRLGHVLLNILVNAAQAIPEGASASNKIRVRAATRGADHVVISIADTGCGIPAEHLPRLLDPFFTTKPIGQGTGLGLSIVHGILSACGGSLEIESEVGRGSEFRIVLHRGRGAVRPAGQAPATSATRGVIMIVDDEPQILKVFGRALQADHEAATSTHPIEVLAAIRAGARYDCIVCDVMMPELGGPALHAAIQAIDPAQADRMLFVSGGSFNKESDAFAHAMRERYLTKPVSRSDLRSAVNAIVSTARARRAS
jgi:signal transduction histidine kinase/ligand-binding sensor domain-containing protein